MPYKAIPQSNSSQVCCPAESNNFLFKYLSFHSPIRASMLHELLRILPFSYSNTSSPQESGPADRYRSRPSEFIIPFSLDQNANGAGGGRWLHKGTMLHILLEAKGKEKEGNKKKIGGCSARAPTCASLQATLRCSKQCEKGKKPRRMTVADSRRGHTGAEDGFEIRSHCFATTGPPTVSGPAPSKARPFLGDRSRRDVTVDIFDAVLFVCYVTHNTPSPTSPDRFVENASIESCRVVSGGESTPWTPSACPRSQSTAVPLADCQTGPHFNLRSCF